MIANIILFGLLLVGASFAVSLLITNVLRLLHVDRCRAISFAQWLPLSGWIGFLLFSFVSTPTPNTAFHVFLLVVGGALVLGASALGSRISKHQ